MKRVKVLVITLMVMVCVHLFSDVSKEEAKNIIFNIVGDNIENVEIYMEENIISDSIFEIDNLRSLTSPYSNYWLFFIDDIPLAMWYHDCRYIMVNVLDGTYTIFDEKFPMWKYKTNLEEVSIPEIPEPEYEPYTNPAPIETRDPDPNKYALIINTGNWGNPNRFWNDMSAMYCSLKENYGFIDENIFVYSLTFNELWDGNISHNLDGDPDDIPEIDGPCFKDDIMARCDWFANNLGPDDQLFVYVESHGLDDGNDSYVDIYEGLVWMIDHWTLLHYNLYDSELAEWLTPINCGEMITMVMACHSGGFKDKLSDYSTYDVQCENRVIHTATDIEHNAWTGIGVTFGFCEFAYYWTTAIRGRHAHHSNPWVPSHNIGEHIYLPHDFDPDNPAGGGLPGDPPNEGNNDGIRQFGEVFEYSIYMDQYCDYKGFIGILPNRELPLVASEIGFIDDVLSMYGYGGDITHSQTVSGDFTFVTPTTIIPGIDLNVDNSTLKIKNTSFTVDNSTITLTDGILELEGASLAEFTNRSHFNTNGSSQIIGHTSQYWYDPSSGYTGPNPPETGNEICVPGDRIIIDDSRIDISEGTLIYSGSDEKWDGFFFNNCNEFISPNGTNWAQCSKLRGNISNIRYIKIGGNSALNIEDANINNIVQMKIFNESQILFNDSDYHHNMSGIYSEESRFLSVDLSIHNNGSSGLVVCNSTLSQSIVETEIFQNEGIGLDIHNCHFNISRSEIKDNERFGYVNLGNIQNLIKYDSEISDNKFAEIAALADCFPLFWTNYHGTPLVKDIEISSNDFFDLYLLMALGTINGEIDCTNLIIDIEDPDRFFPSIDVYNFDEPSTVQSNILYREGMQYISDEEFELAYNTMEQIVIEYPDTFAAKKALAWLPYLNRAICGDSEALYAFIDEIENENLYNTKIEAKAILKMSDKEYEEAISLYEEIITNPPNGYKQLIAELDEAFCYFKLVSSGERNLPENCERKPNNFREYSKIRQEIQSQLLFGNKSNNQENYILSVPVLNNNYPNPFNPSTTISFSIPKESKVDLIIYNIKGQKVKVLAASKFDKGNHSVIWDGNDDTCKPVSSGIYFYKLIINGKTAAVKKCLLLK